MNKTQKLEKFADRELKQLQHKLIVSDGTGGYTAFGKYRIIPKKEHVVVQVKNNETVIFGSKRVAMSWCIADRLQRYQLARNIQLLDNKRQSLAADIYCRQQLANHSRNIDFSESVNTKIQRKIDYFNMLDSELEKCLNSAKYWQLKGFANETARTGRTAAYKTNC
jgi:hypothetical protein